MEQNVEIINLTVSYKDCKKCEKSNCELDYNFIALSAPKAERGDRKN